MQNTLAADARVQLAFVEAAGFCPVHTWHLEALASPRALSAGYAPLVERVAALLGGGPEAELAGLATVVGKACPACTTLREVEAHAVQRLVAFVAQAEGGQEYARSQGVCLRHLPQRCVGIDSTTARFLVVVAARRFGALAEDMQTYTLRFDAIRHGLQNRDEEDAYPRALIHLAGDQSLSLPWSEQVEIQVGQGAWHVAGTRGDRRMHRAAGNPCREPRRRAGRTRRRVGPPSGPRGAAPQTTVESARRPLCAGRRRPPARSCHPWTDSESHARPRS